MPVRSIPKTAIAYLRSSLCTIRNRSEKSIYPWCKPIETAILMMCGIPFDTVESRAEGTRGSRRGEFGASRIHLPNGVKTCSRRGPASAPARIHR